MIELRTWLEDGEPAMSAALSQALPPLLRSATSRPAPGPPMNRAQERLSALHRVSIAETRRHARRLAAFSAALGRHISLSAADLALLRVGSLLHDIGKNSLPPQILFKCGRLSPEEFTAVKFHPVIGDLLCARVPRLQPVRPMVRHHHERLDGSGYPDGLRGDRIPLLAQIVGVVDVYDALVYPRPYKPAFDRDHAFRILWREADLGWRSPDLIEALMEVILDGVGDWLSVVASV